MNTLRVRVRGRVQGVGFRFATYREAELLGLTGWVRNCADGSVEGLFQGPREQLDRMLEWCREGPRFARIESMEHEWVDDPHDHRGFLIR